MTDYTPGTVAMVTNDDEQLLAFRVSWPAEDWMSVDDGSLHAVSDVRPLVVLDPDDETAWLVPMVVAAENYEENTPAEDQSWEDMARAMVRSLTRPPKPPEPQGLGAVVEDSEGEVWVRNCPADCEDGGLCIPWHRAKDASTATYDEFDAVRVLSDGWEPKP